MSGHLLHITRWLRRVLACLALTGAWGPAQALPEAPRCEVALVERRAPQSRRLVSAAPESRARADATAARLDEGDCRAVRVPETLPPGPPRRLFLTHRALLR